MRRPASGARTPVLVSVPHYGTEALPHITRDHYREPWFETFAYGFADTFARPARRYASRVVSRANASSPPRDKGV